MVSANPAKIPANIDQEPFPQLIDPKPRKKTLSASDMVFCELIAKGVEKRQAWKTANPQSNALPTSCSVAASRLLAKPDILERISWCREQIARGPQIIQGVMERDHKRVILRQWVEDETLDHSIRLRAIELDNAMAGHIAPKQSVVLSGNLSIASKLLEGFSAKPSLPGDSAIALPEPAKELNLPIEAQKVAQPIESQG